MSSRRANAPLHPFLMALYPMIAMLASNRGQVNPGLATRAAVLSLMLAAVGLILLRLLLGRWTPAALITTLALLLFYSYGHAYNALRTVELAGTTLGRHRYLLPVWLALALAGTWLIVARMTFQGWLTPALNLAIGAALLLPLGQLVFFQIAAISPRADPSGLSQLLEHRASAQPSADELPDIYYIVLDAYTSEQVLLESFDLDNRPFLDRLTAMGFYVANCSQSNYAQTELSLASTLNLVYLEDLIDESLAGEVGRRQLWPFMRHSLLRQFLEDIGYRTVAFETGYYWSEWEDADHYLAPDRGPLRGLSAFEATLLRSTAAWALIDALPTLPAFLVRDLDRSADAHRERLLFVLEQLAELAWEPGPKFVFAHIVSPHRPFVFDAEGNQVQDDYDWSPSNLGEEAYRAGYREQLLYLNGRMEGVLRAILESEDPAPIVVIQGDHGPEEGSSQDRMSVLNAIRLGSSEPAELQPGLTPVNTFRIVLNHLVGTDLAPLPDRSYFSVYAEPFDYSVVSNDCFE